MGEHLPPSTNSESLSTVGVTRSTALDPPRLATCRVWVVFSFSCENRLEECPGRCQGADVASRTAVVNQTAPASWPCGLPSSRDFAHKPTALPSDTHLMNAVRRRASDDLIPAKAHRWFDSYLQTEMRYCVGHRFCQASVRNM
jgi:hypothetical protein